MPEKTFENNFEHSRNAKFKFGRDNLIIGMMF